MKVTHVALVVALGTVGVAAFSQQQPSRRELETFTAAAKARVVDQLKDPGSAQFRGLFVSRSAGGELMLCGEFNAKTSYGGYAGFQAFISSTGSMVYMGDQISALLPEYCSSPVASIKK